MLACLYNLTCLGTAAFISDFSVFDKEYLKIKPSKCKGSLLISEMGELKSQRKEENAMETFAIIMSSVCITCCKLKEPFGCMEEQ